MTSEPPPVLRAVLLGASNVTFALRTWVARLRAAAGGPVEVLAACGNGRSYGKWSRLLYVRRLPGIVECGLWEALAARPPLPTVALVADVGNDILYQEEPVRIAAWVGACVERLAAHGARPVLTLGSMPVIRIRLLLSVTPADGGEPLEWESEYKNPPRDPEIQIAVPGGPRRARLLRLEITDVASGDIANVHIRELSLE